MTRCPAMKHKTFSTDGDLQCEREVDADGRHKGQHEAIRHVPATGDRPAYDRLATWSNDGGKETAAIDVASLLVCVECGGRYETTGVTNFNPSVAPLSPGATPSSQGEPTPGRCFHCSHWLASAETHAAGWHTEGRGLQRRRCRTVVLHNDDQGWYPNGLYGWSQGVTGAFGDRKVII